MSDQVSDATIDDELLNRYADGDLSASEAESVRSTLEGDAGAQAQYDAILQLRTMIDASGQEMAAGADPDRMFAAIEAGIAQEASETQAAAIPRAEPEQPGLWARLMSGWIPAAGTIAAIGAVLLTIYSPVTPDELVPPEPQIAADGDGPPAALDEAAGDEAPASDEAASDEPTELAAAPSARSEIVEVDFGQNAGTVFEIALENGSSTPVVWINDDE